MEVKISCINKNDRNNPYEAITHVGGLNPDGTKWRLSRQETIQSIYDDKYNFYVEVNNDRVEVIVAVSPYGHKYLKTVADGDKPNNLLSLDECPL